jgi:hypothetical protein
MDRVWAGVLIFSNHHCAYVLDRPTRDTKVTSQLQAVRRGPDLWSRKPERRAWHGHQQLKVVKLPRQRETESVPDTFFELEGDGAARRRAASE